MGAHAIFPVLLILLQKDWGVALVMLFIVVVMLIMAGLSCRWILLGCAAAVVFAPLAWFFLLDDYQKIRFVLLKNPEAYALGQAYQPSARGSCSVSVYSARITAMSPICITI